MKKKMISLFMVFAVVLPIIFTPLQAKAETKSEPRVQGPCFNQAAIDLYSDQRKLWKQHVFWTRAYLVSAIAGLEDQDAMLKRLLQNQVDLGNAIKPYYGQAAGDQLTKLLTEHIVIAGKLIDALKKGDKTTAQKLNREWYRNADDIAKFLSKANPNWSEKELKELLYMHLKILTDEVAARLMKDWSNEIKAFDKGERHIVLIADKLTNGIMKQFPNQFRN